MLAANLANMHGPTPNDFLLGELDVHVAPFTDPTNERFVGRTEAEKTFSPSLEFADWFTGVPQVLYITAASKAEYSMQFMFKQVGDITLVGLALNLEVDYTDPGADIGYFGSAPLALLECRWRFVTVLADGRYWQMVFRRAVIKNPEDFTTGSGAWASMPVTVASMKDDTICDKQRDMGFICIEKLATPSGGFTDPCATSIAACDPD